VCAATGKLFEAPTRFTTVLDVPNGGVLWALPALLENGLLRHTREYFNLPKGFYSLVQIFILLAFMALIRIRTIEQLRYSPPGELGKLLGLDRIPEVRTLREKVNLLSDPIIVSKWSKILSREWMEADPQAAGVLYVDGHIRVYHGSQTKLPRRYVARERLCLRGITDYYVNDQLGRPFFVISTPLTSGILAMLREEIVPRLLSDVPNQPSKAELEANSYLHRFALVFDREGYSPDYLKEMKEIRIACQTYNKFPKCDWPESEFYEQSTVIPHGQTVEMNLAERGVCLNNGLWVREIRKLSRLGHQTSVLSTDYTSNASQIAAHMFTRWSQENFFKYMIQHFNIDALSGYELQPICETSKVVNPAHRNLEIQIKSMAGKLGRKLATFAKITLQEELSPKQIATYERKKGELKEEIDLLRNQLDQAKEQRKQTKRHIMLAELPETEQFAQLSPTKKQFIDTIRMISYRAETSMSIILREVMARSDDSRSLIRELFRTEADLVPNEEEGTLTVRLHHLTNRMSDESVRFLADQLNATETIYPGTNLRLIYKLVSD